MYENAVHYIWGENNEGWHLLKSDDLSVIEERMPAGAVERLHFHKKAQQVFYILSGEAVFEIDENMIVLKAGDSLHIMPE